MHACMVTNLTQEGKSMPLIACNKEDSCSACDPAWNYNSTITIKGQDHMILGCVVATIHLSACD